MKKNSKNNTAPIVDEFSNFFSAEPDPDEKAWGIIHDFYHGILTHMEKNNISRSDLAKKLNQSRSAISQMFNKTPNVTLKKMVEIADALNQNLKISLETIVSIVEEADNRPANASFIQAKVGNVMADANNESSPSKIISLERRRVASAAINSQMDFLDAAIG